MSTISLKLAEADAKRLVELAAREGVTPEEAAVRAVKERLDADLAARREIEAGLSELDDGQGMTLADYEREMDAFMSVLQSERA